MLCVGPFAKPNTDDHNFQLLLRHFRPNHCKCYQLRQSEDDFCFVWGPFSKSPHTDDDYHNSKFRPFSNTLLPTFDDQFPTAGYGGPFQSHPVLTTITTYPSHDGDDFFFQTKLNNVTITITSDPSDPTRRIYYRLKRRAPVTRRPTKTLTINYYDDNNFNKLLLIDGLA